MRHATHLDPKEIHLVMIHVWKRAMTFGAVFAAGLALPAMAGSGPSARLVSCGTETCLLVSGHRDDTASTVRINGHALDVEGERNWRVRLPIATVRDWSVPFARRIEVSTDDRAKRQAVSQHAALPIGLLGHVPDLASLVITLH